MDSDYYSQSQNTNSLVSNTGSAGTIIRLQMKNFMCHDNLEVNFNPRINFICGKNGSGKSAIQTAIAIGLGGKALATNRGSSLKALIKNDKNSCNITITLSNEGKMAYNIHEYGPFIQIERLFSHSSQGYKIRNSSGKVVSTEKKELEKIISYFNIQTDNPVCILHQDIARNFLNTSDPKNKYKFFLKASRLEDITDLYAESTSKLSSALKLVDEKFESLKDAFKDVIEMKKKLKTLEDAKEKRKQRLDLENELIWAKIRETNLEIKALQKTKEKEFLAKKITEKELSEGDVDTMQEKLGQLAQKISEIDERVKDAREKLRSARDDYSNKKQELSNFVTEVKEAKQKSKLIQRKYESCVAEIENLTKNAPEIKLQKERMKKELAEYEKSIEGIKAAEQSFMHDRQQLQDTIDKIKADLQSVNVRHSELQKQKSKRTNQINKLMLNSESLTVYGNLMEKIVEEINKAHLQHKFKKKPIGPIGMHIKVRDPKWAGAVENFLGKAFLSSFCVDNSKDYKVLDNLLTSICRPYNASSPLITLSKFFNKVHEIREGETGTREHSNLARALEINNPVVYNCLIDQREVECVLLIPTNNEAYQLLDEQHKVPKNCKRAFTQTGDMFIPAPNYKSYSNPKPISHATLLQAKQEDLIGELNNEIIKVVREMEELEQDRQRIEQQIIDTAESLKRNETELKNLQRQKYSMDQKINDLKASIDTDKENNLAYLVAESKELKCHMEKESENVEKLCSEYEELKIVTNEAKTSYENLQNTIAESDREKVPLQSEIQGLKSAIEKTSGRKDLLLEKLKQHDSNINSIENELTELTEQVTQNSQNASQLCNPVNTQRDTKQIMRDLKSIELYLKNLEEQTGGSLDILQKDYIERQDYFSAVSNDLNNLVNLVQKARKALLQRKGREFKLQTMLANSAKHNFQIYVNERNFDGKLEFDHDEKTLEIKVWPLNEKDPSTKKLGTASLSGGEKSFSTVCFIMSLWREVELPFHFLDEFDVFMDGVNRHTVMDLLIYYASRSKRQFVFLTPLDTSSISISDIITIHRLEAPRQ